MKLEKAKSEEHGTPIWLWQRLNEIYRFGLDAAASDENHLAEKYFTKSDNALTKDWGIYGSVFVNPPYNCDALLAFTEKAVVTCAYGVTTIVMLMPAKTNQPWWKLAIRAARHVYFIQGRLRYRGNSGGAMLASVVIEYSQKSEPYSLLSECHKFDTLAQPPWKVQAQAETAWRESRKK